MGRLAENISITEHQLLNLAGERTAESLLGQLSAAEPRDSQPVHHGLVTESISSLTAFAKQNELLLALVQQIARQPHRG